MNPTETHQQTLKKHLGSLPSDSISFDPEDLKTYGRDWTKFHDPAPSAVAFPRSAQEVAEILRFCSKNKIPVVPSGGRTGLSGGAVAAHGELVLSLRKMNRIGTVDTSTRTLFVEAGAITQTVHEHCAQYGMTWPVDFASKGSSHVGGNISTNAGGIRVIKYGLTRNWVLGLQVVTPAGDILELNGTLEKNNTGLDLRQLYIGTEGTLGVVAGAILKLAPLPKKQDLLFFTLNDMNAVLALFADVRKQRFSLSAYEMMTDSCVRAVLENTPTVFPFKEHAPCYVLVEVEDCARPEELDAWVESLFERGLVLDGVAATNSTETRNFWALRENIAEAVGAKGLTHKQDISVPVPSLVSFVEELLETFQTSFHGYEVYVFGHIGDGNLHLGTVKPQNLSREDFVLECRKMDDALYRLIQKHRGSVSAEHGIGLLKKKALGFSRSPEEIRILNAVKKALDPSCILNPGKILD